TRTCAPRPTRAPSSWTSWRAPTWPAPGAPAGTSRRCAARPPPSPDDPDPPEVHAMSNLDRRPPSRELGGLEGTPAGPVLDLLPGKEVLLGESTRVRRLLPTLGRRLLGAWAFVDHYGPDDITSSPGMQVPPHPHTGLQTVSWLLEGEVHHRDSLGSDTSPGSAHTPLVGADLDLAAGADVELPLEPDFEYTLLASSGAAEVEDAPLEIGAMLYLGTGRHSVRVRAAEATRLLLLGGEPFEERIVMWWNFVGRS